MGNRMCICVRILRRSCSVDPAQRLSACSDVTTPCKYFRMRRGTTTARSFRVFTSSGCVSRNERRDEQRPPRKDLLAARRLSDEECRCYSEAQFATTARTRSSIGAISDWSQWFTHSSLSTLFHVCNCSLSAADLCDTIKCTLVISRISQCLCEARSYAAIGQRKGAKWDECPAHPGDTLWNLWNNRLFRTITQFYRC